MFACVYFHVLYTSKLGSLRKKEKEEEEEKRTLLETSERIGVVAAVEFCCCMYMYVRCRCSFYSYSNCVCTEKRESEQASKKAKKEKREKKNDEYTFILQYSTLDNYDLWPTCMYAENIILSKDSRRLIVNNNHN